LALIISSICFIMTFYYRDFVLTLLPANHIPQEPASLDFLKANGRRTSP
jgi:hypothetical protein